MERRCEICKKSLGPFRQYLKDISPADELIIAPVCADCWDIMRLAPEIKDLAGGMEIE